MTRVLQNPLIYNQLYNFAWFQYVRLLVLQHCFPLQTFALASTSIHFITASREGRWELLLYIRNNV